MQPRPLFLDLETTGPVPARDFVLEIGAVAVADDLTTLGTFHRIIPYSQFELDHALASNPKVRDMHVASGLYDACIAAYEELGGRDVYASHIRRADVELALWTEEMGYPPGVAVLAGHSIHFDLSFVRADLREFAERLHYRLLDIGAIRDFLERCTVSLHQLPARPEMPHRALDDAQIELNEALAIVKAVQRQPWCAQKMVDSAFVQK